MGRADARLWRVLLAFRLAGEGAIDGVRVPSHDWKAVSAAVSAHLAGQTKTAQRDSPVGGAALGGSMGGS